MTSPWGNPPPLPNPPRVWPAAAPESFSAPVLLPPHSSVPCLTDPALQVWRPGPDMVEAMCPPVRWHVTPAGVGVSL